MCAAPEVYAALWGCRLFSGLPTTQGTVALLDQEEHREHAKQEKRGPKPGDVIDGNLWNLHQCHHHDEQH